MRRESLARLRPVCPVCLAAGRTPNPLKLGEVFAEHQDRILQAILHCPEPACQREYPVLDGIGIFLADVRSYISDQIAALTARQDLVEPLESLLGDCCGPGTPWDSEHQQLSSYGWDHYGEYDPQLPAVDEEANPLPRPGSVVRCLNAAWQMAADFRHVENTEIEAGPILDIGCGMGRSTLELARRSAGPVVGIDMNFSMLRKAISVVRHGRLTYPLRRLGMVYDRREFAVSNEGAEQAEFWVADALALPFAPGSVAMTSAFNVLDCVVSPAQLIRELGRVTTSLGLTMLASPYDWAASATPFEQWLGGHSQRSPDCGSAEPVLRRLLEKPMIAGDPQWEVVAEQAQFPWQVRVHQRSTVAYQNHLVVARRL